MDEPLREPPVAGDEVATVLGSLERQRATFAWKCGGVDAAGLRATVGASTMTIGGLLKHLAQVEDYYFSLQLRGEPPAEWAGRPPEWTRDPDWVWRVADDETPEQLLALWRETVERSRAATAAALAEGGLDQRVRWTRWTEPASMRRMLADLVEEYARHVGHADVIRESVDGLVGEDPPR